MCFFFQKIFGTKKANNRYNNIVRVYGYIQDRDLVDKLFAMPSDAPVRKTFKLFRVNNPREHDDEELEIT